VSVMPMIQVEAVDDVRDFYVDKLGFEHRMAVVGKDGTLDFCNLVLGDAALMFMRSPEGGPATAASGDQAVELYVEVDDVDGHHTTIRDRGVDVLDPLTDQWWGDRTFVVSDPNGYRVWFFQKIAEPVPPPGMKIV